MQTQVDQKVKREKKIITGCFKYLKSDTNLFILFKALGAKSDLEILETIYYDVTDPANADQIEMLKETME